MLDQAGWIRNFKGLGAFWEYEGTACQERPHAKMSNGQHSGGYFNSAPLIRRPSICLNICADLISSLKSAGPVNPDSIWGSAMGAITLAYELARQMDRATGFTVKHVHDDGMFAGRFPVTEDERVLMVEDVLITGTTTRNSITALEVNGAKVLPFILVLVNRSGMTHLDDRQIISLIDRELPIWDEEDCLYCKAGSKAIRPKEPKGNWALLNC